MGIPIRKHFIATFISRIIVVDFPHRAHDLPSLWLLTKLTVKYGFHLMAQALNPNKSDGGPQLENVQRMKDFGALGLNRIFFLSHLSPQGSGTYVGEKTERL